MKSTFMDSPEFQRLIRGDETADLTRVALEIASDAESSLDLNATLARIERLGERIRERCPNGAGLRHILGQINWVLFIEEKFRGNTDDYYDPRNSYLNDVLDRKLGIPISLSVLYLAVAERIGLDMAGVNLPGHFIVRAGRGLRTIFVDPFHAGALIDRTGCQALIAEVTGQHIELTDEQLAPCAKSAIVARMLYNLKAVYLKNAEYTMALPVMRRLVAITHEEPIERRDLAVACMHADRPGEAIDHLRAYIRSAPKAPDARQLTDLLRTAEHEIARWN